MNTIIKEILIIGVLLFFGFSCYQDDLIDENISVVDLDNEASHTKFDKYLEAKFTQPYNIDYVYRWNDNEADMNYSLVPPKYDKAIQMANLIKYLFLDVYEAVAPKNFLKQYCPKMILVIGSAGYRTDGSSIAGNADGGLKITLYEINKLNPSNVNKLFDDYFRTLYHEFSHILHQKIDYTNDFDKISEQDYKSGSWMTAWEGRWPKDKDLSALKRGFVSTYASKEPNEDFVELIAHYVTSTEEKWNKTLEKAGTDGAEGKEIILKKMNIVRKYLNEVWKIDIDKLRAELLKQANKLNTIDLNNINL